MSGAGEPVETAAPHLPRRQAIIVAIDAAGYSRQSEIDARALGGNPIGDGG